MTACASTSPWCPPPGCCGVIFTHHSHSIPAAPHPVFATGLVSRHGSEFGTSQVCRFCNVRGGSNLWGSKVLAKSLQAALRGTQPATRRAATRKPALAALPSSSQATKSNPTNRRPAPAARRPTNPTNRAPQLAGLRILRIAPRSSQAYESRIAPRSRGIGIAPRCSQSLPSRSQASQLLWRQRAPVCKRFGAPKIVRAGAPRA